MSIKYKKSITDFPTSLKNPASLTVKLGGTVNQTYDGSAAKTVDITPSGIGAAAAEHTHAAASAASAGFMAAADKSKLDGIAAGANKYTHPTTAGNKHIPSGGTVYNILRNSADGTAVWTNVVATAGAQFGLGLDDSYGYASFYYNGETTGGAYGSADGLIFRPSANGKGSLGLTANRFAKGYINNLYGTNVYSACQVVVMGTTSAAVGYKSGRTKALIEFWKTSVSASTSSGSSTVYDSALITGLSSSMTAVNGKVISSGIDFSFVYSISTGGAITPQGNFDKYRITYFN